MADVRGAGSVIILRVRQAAMRKRVSIALGIVILVIASSVLLAPAPPRVPVSGDLPAKDVASILRLVRADLRREILPDFSWVSVKDLPNTIRSYRSERVYGIDVVTNGTVWVRTVADSSESYGSEYFLRRGRDGWQITQSGWWTPGGVIIVDSTAQFNELGAANGSQPIRSETNGTSSTAPVADLVRPLTP